MDNSILIMWKEREKKNMLYSREKKKKIYKKGERESNNTVHQTPITCFIRIKGRKEGRKEGRENKEDREKENYKRKEKCSF